MNYPIDDVREELETNDVVLLDQFLDDAEELCDQLQYLTIKKQYLPLQYSWSAYKGKDFNALLVPVTVFLQEVTGKSFVPELLVLEAGDYSLLNDEAPAENGVVAFLDLSLGWEPDWGGYLAIGNQPMPLNPNNLLIANMKDQRWFIKKINHHAQLKKIIVVFRES